MSLLVQDGQFQRPMSDDEATAHAEFVVEQAARAWGVVRAERDRLLAASDWTQVADAPLADAQKYAWADYRQTLRNIPQDYATPDEVVWPTPPA